MSKYEGETVRPGVGREYTFGGKLRRITLKILVFVLIFGLGFIFGEFGSTDQTTQENQIDKSNQIEVFVYDTEEKIEDFYKIFESGFSEEMELPPESPEVKERMASIRTNLGQPLVAVGPFAVLVNHDGGTFSVHEIKSVKQEGGMLLPLVKLETTEQFKRLRLFTSQEKGWGLPRFHAHLTYSVDGIYERGYFSVHREEDGALERMYFDSKGIGSFDVMNVFEHEDGVRFIYSLNNFTWKLVDEQWYSEKEKKRIDGLLKDYHRFFKGSEQVDHNTSSDNQDIDVEQVE